MHLFPKGQELNSLPLVQLGPEPLSEEFTVDYLSGKVGENNRKIKPVLLDQTIVVGIGNIYVDEVIISFRVSIQKE